MPAYGVIVVLLLLAAAFFSTIFLLIPWLIRKATGKTRYAVAWIVVVVVLTAGASVRIAMDAAAIAPAPAIAIPVDTTSANGALTIAALRVDVHSDDSATITVDVVNRGDSEQLLGLEYYADGGTLAGGLYSPGAGARAMAEPVAPGMSGPVRFDIRLYGLGHGAYVDLSLYRCTKAPSGTFIDPSEEKLFAQKIDLVEAERRP